MLLLTLLGGATSATTPTTPVDLVGRAGSRLGFGPLSNLPFGAEPTPPLIPSVPGPLYMSKLGFGPLAAAPWAAGIPPVTVPTTGKNVGWFDEWDPRLRNRHDPEELERRLKVQRGFNYEAYQEITAPVALKHVTIKAPGAAVPQVVLVDDDFDEETILAIVAGLEEADLLG